MSSWKDTNILLFLSFNAEEDSQWKSHMTALLGYYSASPSIFSLCPSTIPLCTFSTSIIFNKSQIYHGHASGRFPSTFDGSIIPSSFAWLKPDKHNALCSTGDAFCIILVFEYISEYLPMDWSLFLALSSRTDSESYSSMKMTFCWEES